MLTAGLLAGCSLGKFKPSGDAQKDIREAYQKLNSAYPYRLTENYRLTASPVGDGGTKGQSSTRVVEFAAADRIHSRMVDSEGLTLFEGITFGDKSYMKKGDKWSELSQSEGPLKESMEKKEKMISSFLKDVQLSGTETMNGVSCSAYAARVEGDMGGQAFTGSSKIWVGNPDGLLHQTDSNTKMANYASRSQVVYEYNVDIKIEQPVP
jgi:hypothetical protein